MTIVCEIAIEVKVIHNSEHKAPFEPAAARAKKQGRYKQTTTNNCVTHDPTKHCYNNGEKTPVSSTDLEKPNVDFNRGTSEVTCLMLFDSTPAGGS